ncbi:MAG: hypothetical protein VYC34_07890 [Planctomycetota bacterium]|nr:hypothetical protein [Planctomycetota bacterium]
MTTPTTNDRRLLSQTAVRAAIALAIAGTFVFVATRIDPAPTKADSTVDEPAKQGGAADEARLKSGKSLGSIEGPHGAIRFHAGIDAPRFTFVDAEGRVIHRSLTLEEAMDRRPESALDTLTAFEPVSGPLMLHVEGDEPF